MIFYWVVAAILAVVFVWAGEGFLTKPYESREWLYLVLFSLAAACVWPLVSLWVLSTIIYEAVTASSP